MLVFGGIVLSIESHGALLAVWIVKAQRFPLGVCDNPRVSQKCPLLVALSRLELAVKPALPIVIQPIHLANTSAIVLEDDGSWIQIRSRDNIGHLRGVLQARFKNPRT